MPFSVEEGDVLRKDSGVCVGELERFILFVLIEGGIVVDLLYLDIA